MTKTDIIKNYNVGEILSADDLKSLAKTYKDNLENIPVMMIKKKPNNSVTSQILEELKKINSRLFGVEQRLSNVEQRLSTLEQNQQKDHKMLLNLDKRLSILEQNQANDHKLLLSLDNKLNNVIQLNNLKVE